LPATALDPLLFQPVGGRYDTHHGLADGVILPHVSGLQQEGYCSQDSAHCPHGGFAESRFFSCTGLNSGLRKKLVVPHAVAELGVKKADVKAMAAGAVKDPAASANPPRRTESEFEQLVLAGVHGDLGE